MSLHQTLHRHNQMVGHRLNAKRAATARGLPGLTPQRGAPLGGRMGRMGFVSPYISPAPVHFSSDPNAIVTVQVRTIVAPSPNTYQQTGALVSYGGTTLNPLEVQELTQREDLDLVALPEMEISTVTWGVGGVVTVETVDEMPAEMQAGVGYYAIRGMVPEAYNAPHVNIASQGPTTFTYTSPLLQTDPGPAEEMGVVQSEFSIELGQMATTFFDQGNAISVFVLELGAESNFSERARKLEEWLATNPRTFYGYLLPRSHGTSADKIEDFRNLFKQYQNPEAMTYFWLTVDKEEIAILDPTYKCVVQTCEAPSVHDPLNATDPYGEFTAAAMFYNAMIYRPSNALRISPMAFKFAYGVTPYPTQNNGPLLKSFKDNATNYISTGAEGGISFNMVYSGVTKDGMDYFNWWWTIDFVQIKVNQDVANAIINGSNNALAPLYYDQSGIDSLLSTLANSMAACKAFGMVVGPLMMSGLTGDQLQSNIDTGIYEGACNVNAVPFIPYAQANPGHYKIGEYDGLSVLFIPKRGFIHVLITIAASQLVTI